MVILLWPMPPRPRAAAAELPPAPAEASVPPAGPAGRPVRSERVDYPALGLALDAGPFYTHVGDAVTVTLTARNDGVLALEGVVVSLTVPAGLGDVASRGGFYDPISGRFTLPLPRLEAGRALSATLAARVRAPALARGGVALWAEGAGGPLRFPVRAGALLVVGDPAFEVPAGVSFDPRVGGRLVSADGRVTVDIPGGALLAPGPVRAEHRPWGLLRRTWPPAAWPGAWAGYHRTLPAFELTAADAGGGPLRAFARPVTLTVAYDPAAVAALGLAEADLTLFWWDADYVLTPTEGLTTTGLWRSLPTRVDRGSQTVTAAVDHFTPFALGDGSSPSDAFLPGVQGFQVSLFTGAGLASYPLAVPAGPGGLAPDLTLSYSSAAYDGKSGSRDEQQAGWVGRGWSLGTDYIAVVKNPANGGRNRNSYSLVLNGVSADLVRHNDSEDGLPNPHYHVADEQFWRVWQVEVGAGTHYEDEDPLPDTVWYVKTKDGTLYQFGSTTPEDFGHRAWWAFDRANAEHPEGCGNYIEPYKWYLTQVTDVHGNTIAYSYNWTGYDGSYNKCGESVAGWVMADVWPTAIQWGSSGNLRYQVVFESSARTQDTACEKVPAQLWQAPCETRRLDGLRVESMPGTTWELVRRYDFTYDYSLRPDDRDPADPTYPKLTLKSAQLKGADGTPFPATTFSYKMTGAAHEDGRYRLETVDNGLGGVVSYGYEDFFFSASGNHRHRVVTRTAQDGLGHSYAWSYSYVNGKENHQGNSAAVWYALHVAEDTSYLVHPAYGEFRGHREVLETDPNGNQTEHWYYQGDGYLEDGSTCTIGAYNDACYQLLEDREALKGQEWKTVRHTSSLGVTYSKSYRDFTVEHLAFSTDLRYGLRRNFAYQEQAREYTYDGDSDYKQRTTRYRYDPTYQGGTQWGNQTHVLEYGERDPATQDPVRVTLREYRPNAGAWLVGAVAQEVVYDGPAVLANWRELTYYVYDQQSPFVAPTVGNLTREMRVRDLNLETWWATTEDTAWGYDSYGNRTTATVYNAYGGCQPWAGGGYSPAGSDPRTTTTTYDATYHVFPTSVTYPNERSEAAGYDYRMGLVTSYTDVNDVTTQYRYDPFGRLWKLWRPDDTEEKPTVLHVYEINTLSPAPPLMWAVWRKGDPTAAPWTVGGTWERRFYDGLGRPVQTQTPHWNWNGTTAGHDVVMARKYDGLGQVISQTVAFTKTAYVCAGPPCANPYYTTGLGGKPKTLTAYDPLGRVTQVTHPDGSTVRTTYDQWVTAEYNEENHKVERETDGLGRLVYVREYTGADPYTWYTTTSYGYNTRDQLTDVWDEAGNHTQIVYDRLGRKTELTDPDMGPWYYAYDPLGHMTSQTDARNQTIAFTYDTMDRVTLRDAPGTGSDVTYQYDNALGDAGVANSWGRLRRAYVGAGVTTNARQYKYDSRGRTSWERVTLDGANYDTAYTYDSADRVQTMTYPGGEVVASYYHPNGQVRRVASATTVYLSHASYTPWGAPALLQFGQDGSDLPILKVDHTYYSWTGGGGAGRARLARLTAGPRANPTSLQDLRYEYDLAGNVATIQDYQAGSPQTQSFAYDDLDRILSAGASGGTGGTYSEVYAYSGTSGKLGNLTSKGGVAYTYGTQSASCPDGALTKPHAVVTAGSNTFCYDRSGNMVKRNSGAYTLTYDAENRLVGVSGGATAAFVYGPGGERVQGTVNGTTTLYIGAHYEKQGSVVRKYYYAGSTRVAMRENGTLYWLLSDHLGSQAITAEVDGDKFAEVRYKAWGEDRYTSGATPTTYRYTGQRWESYINIYYYGARWYDQSLGRFIQPDTIIPQPGDPPQLNRYTYVRNNPVRYTDPSGHCTPGVDCPGDKNDELGNPPETDYQVAWEAYARVAAEADREAYRGFLQEYLAYRAVYFENLASGMPAEVVEDSAAHVDSALSRLKMNGYFGTGAAMETAGDVAGGGPELALSSVTGLYTLGSAALTAGAVQRFSGDQTALIDLAQEAKQRGGVTPDPDEVTTMLNWAQEYNVPHRGPETHLSRPFNIPHIHIGPVSHIPINP